MNLLGVSPDTCLMAAEPVGDIACMHASRPDDVNRVLCRHAELTNDQRDPFGVALNVAIVVLESPMAGASLDWLRSLVAEAPGEQRSAYVNTILMVADHLSQRTGRSSSVDQLRHDLMATIT